MPLGFVDGAADVENDKIHPLSLEFAVSAFKSIKFFHSSLPFQHLGQSSFCINQVTFYSIVEQVPGVLKIYSTYLYLGNDVTSSDKTL